MLLADSFTEQPFLVSFKQASGCSCASMSITYPVFCQQYKVLDRGLAGIFFQGQALYST